MQHLCGWRKPTPHQTAAVMATLPMPVFGDVHANIKGSGKGKTVLLYEYTRKLYGKDIAQIQAIGDCCSFGAAHAIDYTYCTEIVYKGELEEWVALTSTEDIYGGGRVQIGHGALSGGDGSSGAWCASYCNEYGTLVRQKYEHDDLTIYSGDRAKKWGESGTPEYLFEESRHHRIKTVSLVRTYEELRDAIANGYAVTIASNQGFNKTRDSLGRCSIEGTWSHQLSCIAINDDVHNPMCCILNSWGDYMSGPLYLNQPNESFWVDSNIVEERMLSEGDSWAYSDREGYPIKELDLQIV